MRVPTADELAAIAAAYLVVTRSAVTAAPPSVPRWRLAGRLPGAVPEMVRAAARARSRWTLAGRLDG
ncbi:MAG TPA: hypothetical protein VMD91_04395 [Candidatus Sulfotelmatobacter sp.]|nr:hypothetical protein [Candidatus Sulfotelmatobacter sp.]